MKEVDLRVIDLAHPCSMRMNLNLREDEYNTSVVTYYFRLYT